jgi:hypothetical protein
MRKFLLALALLLTIPALTPRPVASANKALGCFRVCQNCSAQGLGCCQNDPPNQNTCYCC